MILTHSNIWFILYFLSIYVYSMWYEQMKGSRTHIGCLNLSSCFNIPSHFTNHMIQELKLNFPLFTLLTEGRTGTSIQFLTLYSFCSVLIFLSPKTVLHYSFQDQAFNFSWINSILIWSISVSFSLIFSKIIKGQKWVTCK